MKNTSKREDSKKINEQEELDLLNLGLESQIEVVEEKYSIFNYLKKTPSITIAIISGIIAICSVIFDYISELSIDITLNHWQIDRSMVIIDNALLIKKIGIICIILFLHFLAFYLIYNAFLAHKSYNIYYFKEKESNVKHREMLDNISSTTNDEQELIKYKELKELSYKDDELIKELKKDNPIELWIHLIIGSFLLGCSTIILFIVEINKFEPLMNSFKTKIMVSLAILIEIIVYNLIGLGLSKLSFKLSKKIYKTVSRDNIENNIKYEYPLAKIFTKGIKTLFSNKTIIASLIMSIFLVFILASFQALITFSNLDEQTTFKTTNVHNQEYAVVFSDKNNLFLEEIVYNKDNAVIYTSKQLIIPKTNANLVLKNFKKVETFDKQINDKKQTNQKN